MNKLQIVLLFSCCLLFFSCAMRLDQLFKTSLQITVRNELGNLQEDVEVQLYKSQEDYDSNSNPLGEAQMTDKRGRVTFKDLEPTVYFVNAEKGDINNFGAGEKTDTLEANKINKVTIIIE